MARKQLDTNQSAEVTQEAPSTEFEVPFTEHEAPVEANEAPLELVTTPGPKKTIRFEGDAPEASSDVEFEEQAAEPSDDWIDHAPATNLDARRRQPEGLQDIHAGIDRLGPDPRFGGRPRGTSLAPVSIRSRTVYTTERGGEVRSYESTTSSARTITLAERGREVPFHSSLVDNVVGAPASNDDPSNGAGSAEEATAALTETTSSPPTAQAKEERPRRRFGFFGRRPPKVEFKPDGQGDPNVDHTYLAATAVDSLPVQPQQVAPPRSTANPAAAGAWDPGQASSQDVVFREHAAPQSLESETSVESTTWNAPRRPARKVAARAPRAGTRKTSVPKRKPLLAYPGDNHPVIDIEGIGPTYAKRLEKAGILTTGQLAVAKPGRVAVQVNAPKKTVQSWKAQADLLKVKGVGPQFAEAMARAGIDGIDGLKKKSATKIAGQVTRYLDSLGTNVVGQPVTPKRVAKWKTAAQRMRKTKTTAEVLATPTHGIPPPWLREETKPAKSAKRPAAKGKAGAKGRGRKKR